MNPSAAPFDPKNFGNSRSESNYQGKEKPPTGSIPWDNNSKSDDRTGFSNSTGNPSTQSRPRFSRPGYSGKIKSESARDKIINKQKIEISKRIIKEVIPPEEEKQLEILKQKTQEENKRKDQIKTAYHNLVEEYENHLDEFSMMKDGMHMKENGIIVRLDEYFGLTGSYPYLHQLYGCRMAFIKHLRYHQITPPLFNQIGDIIAYAVETGDLAMWRVLRRCLSTQQLFFQNMNYYVRWIAPGAAIIVTEAALLGYHDPYLTKGITNLQRCFRKQIPLKKEIYHNLNSLYIDWREAVVVLQWNSSLCYKMFRILVRDGLGFLESDPLGFGYSLGIGSIFSNMVSEKSQEMDKRLAVLLQDGDILTKFDILIQLNGRGILDLPRCPERDMLKFFQYTLDVKSPWAIVTLNNIMNASDEIKRKLLLWHNQITWQFGEKTLHRFLNLKNPKLYHRRSNRLVLLSKQFSNLHVESLKEFAEKRHLEYKTLLNWITNPEYYQEIPQIVKYTEAVEEWLEDKYLQLHKQRPLLNYSLTSYPGKLEMVLPIVEIQ